MDERLQKFLAHAGIASRRSAEELILSGRVQVNNVVVTQLGTKINPLRDVVKVNGHVIKKKEELKYYILNKPNGYVTTLKDPQGRPKVIDLLKGVEARLYPVGRLDFATEGLLLMTNDGELSYRLTHPKYKVEKIYVALVRGFPVDDAVEALRRGVMLCDGLTAPAKVRILGQIKGNARIEIGIYEGRNRQVRRMMDSIGHPVIELKRVKFGPIPLGNLPLGKFRPLTENELKALKKSAKME